jgi:hypothetical protein
MGIIVTPSRVNYSKIEGLSCYRFQGFGFLSTRFDGLYIKWCTQFGDVECRLDPGRGKYFKLSSSLYGEMF